MAKQQRSVVVTGVSTGIGLATAKSLLAAGFRVFGSVRRDDDARRLTGELGSGFSPLLFDVTDERAVKTAAARVRSALAGQTLAGLVNNAGIAVAGPLVYLPIADFRKQLEVNLTGVMVTTQAFAPLLGVDRSLKGKPGRIVNISSVLGVVGRASVAGYVSAKHGLIGLTRNLAAELGPHVTANAIAPGYIRTELNVPLQQNKDFNAMLESRTAVARWGKPEDLRGALLLLASDAGSYITGHTLVIDGGLSPILA